MDPPEAQQEFARFIRRARWIVMPIGFGLTMLTLVLLATESALGFVALGAGVAFVLGWNVYAFRKQRTLLRRG